MGACYAFKVAGRLTKVLNHLESVKDKDFSVREGIKIRKEVLALCAKKTNPDTMGTTEVLKAVATGYLNEQDVKKHIKMVKATATDNWGIPAKPYLFRPVAGKDNKKVWPDNREIVDPGQYVIVKGEEYMIPDDFKMLNPPLFKVK